MKNKPGFTLRQGLITGAIVALLAVGGTLLLGSERTRLRDAKRINDITHFAAGFAILYAQKASYSDAAVGCPKKDMLATSCALPSLTGLEDEIKDPGNFKYVVTRVPDAENFAISFRLERSYGALKAGLHHLTKEGIR